MAAILRSFVGSTEHTKTAQKNKFIEVYSKILGLKGFWFDENTFFLEIHQPPFLPSGLQDQMISKLLDIAREYRYRGAFPQY